MDVEFHSGAPGVVLEREKKSWWLQGIVSRGWHTTTTQTTWIFSSHWVCTKSQICLLKVCHYLAAHRPLLHLIPLSKRQNVYICKLLSCSWKVLTQKISGLVPGSRDNLLRRHCQTAQSSLKALMHSDSVLFYWLNVILLRSWSCVRIYHLGGVAYITCKHGRAFG